MTWQTISRRITILIGICGGLFLGFAIVKDEFNRTNINNTRVLGRVIDASGSPVPQYPVIFKGGTEPIVVLTGKDGRFTVNNLSPGQYEISPANQPFMVKQLALEKTYQAWDPRAYFGTAVDVAQVKEVGDLQLSRQDNPR